MIKERLTNQGVRKANCAKLPKYMEAEHSFSEFCYCCFSFPQRLILRSNIT